MQEALVKAWTGGRSLRNPAHFETWLIRILINECRNIQRRTRREAPLPDALPLTGPPDPGLRDALAALDEKYRTPLLLHHMAGYSVAETSKILRASGGVVRWRLEQAKKKLRQLLLDGEGSR